MWSTAAMLSRIPCCTRILLSAYMCTSVAILYVTAPYTNYNFENYPLAELLSLELAYGSALDNYVAQNWRESVTYLELSLRLYRLLKDSVGYCSHSCGYDSHDRFEIADNHLQVFWRVFLRASCVRKCEQRSPVFRFPRPRQEILEDFEKRTPYKYLHFAYHQLNDTEKAATAAHTYLMRRPDDQEMQERLSVYRNLFDLEGILTDHEERQYQRSFLSAVLLCNSGDFPGCAVTMEGALKEYLGEYGLCAAGCEGALHVAKLMEQHASLADALTDALRCKVKCEDNLKPNVGGYFVEKFTATMYHYLQFAYFKMNDPPGAAGCASSYMLLDPDDDIMKQNMEYYHTYSGQWGLEEHHFTPRLEAVKYFNQTSLQRQMLHYAENYVQYDDEEMVRSNEAAAMESMGSPDEEFEGMGDYEEALYADWSQAPKSKGDMGEDDA